MNQSDASDQPRYGEISSTSELGQMVRAHRKARKLTLEEVAGLANLSVRFLSEFERGKDTAEVGKVLKAIRTLGLELSVQARGAVSASPTETKTDDGEARQ